jgi:cytochrome P450
MTTPQTLAAEPAHVRAAPPHPNPYPYYGRLAREQPVFRDEVNGWWVVASAAAVNEVLSSEVCLTRPPGDPVPTAIRAGPMAEIFGRLVRIRNDEARNRLKIAVAAALRGLDPGTVADLTRARAAELDAELGLPLDENKTTQFMFALPVQVTAQLLGIPRERYREIMSWLGDHGVATASAATGVPAPDAALFARGNHAAQALIDLVGALRKNSGAGGPLLDALAQEARRAGCDDDADVIANAIGYLLQGYVATASLIGLTLLALARRPSLRAQVEANRALLREVIQEVLRCDPTTNSTFRFMARSGVIAGQEMQQGDMIIVLIAAANRDGALNPEPDRFDISRQDRKYLEFGGGAHACPADKFAPLIAMVAIDHLLTRGIAFERLESSLSYAASGHIRTPLFKR